MLDGPASRPSGVLLLVEDDPDHAFLVRRRLTESTAVGLPLVHLTTAAAALARIAVGDVRCVVLDLSLPDAHGTEAVQALRAAQPDLPVVVLTGLDSDDAGLQALQAGAQDYLVKGQHAADAVSRAVLFAIERARRQEAERRQALLGRRLRLREVQLAEAQRLARLGSWEWDLSTGEVSWSEELERLSGIRGVTDTGAFARYLERVHVEDRATAVELFSAAAAADGPVLVRHRFWHDDGERWVQGHMTAAGWDAAGRPVRVLGTMQDVTAQKDAEDRLAHQALHDGLTGLVNRGVLLDRLHRVLSRAQADSGEVAVLFLDLDRFKWVNDSRSHAAGDNLLVQVARRLEGALRPTDTLARFGGDEFVVLCEQVRSAPEVDGIVARLAGALEQPFALLGDGDRGPGRVSVTASIGVATARPGTGAVAELLVRDADIAMYRAKERGRACTAVFDDDMRARAVARLQTQDDLRVAVAGPELEVHFQPVVDVDSGTVVGSEALVRWRHPTRGLLAPEDFVPDAEETGLIVPLGDVVLREACAVTAAWNVGRTSPLTVAVNLSARQLTAADLCRTVAAALDETGLEPGLLCLEVTETAVMEDVTRSAAVLGALRRLGVRVAIDDFGTGYSSLAHLLTLPVDVLKVDRSFTGAVDRNGPGVAIVSAVIAMARTLRLGVVAEGVETAAQRAALAGLGVPTAQGFLWGPAVPADDATWAAVAGSAASPAPARARVAAFRAPRGLVPPQGRVVAGGR